MYFGVVYVPGSCIGCMSHVWCVSDSKLGLAACPLICFFSGYSHRNLGVAIEWVIVMRSFVRRSGWAESGVSPVWSGPVWWSQERRITGGAGTGTSPVGWAGSGVSPLNWEWDVIYNVQWKLSVVRETAACPVAAAPTLTVAAVNFSYCCRRRKDPPTVEHSVTSTVSWIFFDKCVVRIIVYSLCKSCR